MRKEHDTLGSISVPPTAYWGAQTARAVENFPISGMRSPRFLIRAYALVKLACAEANAKLELLAQEKAQVIIRASREVARGKFDDQFVVDAFQAGAGTSLNMNMNEVIANRALELLGKKKGCYRYLHPNDDVNMAQSTNDTYPTAMRIAVLFALEELYPTLSGLAKTFKRKGKQFDGIVKVARTHLQDAVPIRLGQEFTAYGVTLEKCLADIQRSRDDLLELGIGGSAAGTGLNTHPEYQNLVIKYVRRETKLPVTPSENLVEIMQSQQAINHVSSSLKNCAVEVNRIARDLRLLSSGPNTGFGEITLPAVQPGSSIMPGKVNPSILECTNMVCLHVIGADITVSTAVGSGEIDLNIFMPLMAHELLHSIEIFGNALRMTDEKCVRGIRANRKTAEGYLEKSPGLVTALNPGLGYEAAAEIAKEFVKGGKPVREIILKKKLLTKEQLDELLDPKKLTEPNISKS